MSPYGNSVQFKTINTSASSFIPKQDVIYNPYTKTYIPKSNTSRKTKQIRQLQYAADDPNNYSWIGDPIQVPAPRQVTRFWYHNCNGMITANDRMRFQHEISSYINKDIHFISLTETRLNVCHKLTTFQIENSFTSMLPNSKIILHNTPGYNSSSSYQPGGITSGFHGRLQQRYVTTTKDKYGRWIANVFKGSKHILRIYTLYRVNPKVGKADISAWAQQKRALQNDNIDDDPKKHVINNLCCEIKNHIDNGDFILIFADLNETVSSRGKNK